MAGTLRRWLAGRRIRRQFTALARPGPHRVLRGDLAYAGMPGVVYTPATGFKLPAVVFGHDWMTTADRYAGLLEHLASWGFVVAAPDTERGLVPSVLTFAADLDRALDIATGVRLGAGQVSVRGDRLAVAGHGFGGSAAVLAAARTPGRFAAAVAIFPARTEPRAEQAAAALALPGAVFTAPGSEKSLRSNAIPLARAWPAATLRVIAKASATGLARHRRLSRFLGLPTADRRTQRRVRALLTGYLLGAVAGEKRYRAFADPAVRLPRTQPVAELPEPVELADKVVALLK